MVARARQFARLARVSRCSSLPPFAYMPGAEVEYESVPQRAGEPLSSSRASSSPDRRLVVLGVVVLAASMVVLGGVVAWLALAMRDLAPTAQRANAVLTAVDAQLSRHNGDMLAAMLGSRSAEHARGVLEKAATISFTIFPSNIVNIMRHMLTYNYPTMANTLISMLGMMNKTMYSYADLAGPSAASTFSGISGVWGQISSVAARIAALTPLTPVTVSDFGVLDLVFGQSPLDWVSSQIAPTSYKALGQACSALINQVRSATWAGSYACSTGTCAWNFTTEVNMALQYLTPGCTTLATYQL